MHVFIRIAVVYGYFLSVSKRDKTQIWSGYFGMVSNFIATIKGMVILELAFSV